MANSVSTQTKKHGIASYLAGEAVKRQITSLVGEKATPTFISSVVSAVTTNPKLAECSNATILSSALLGESLHLTPSPQLGMYYIVPYGDNATFQLGYKGYIQLAIRSGQYKKIVTSVVKDGELKSYNPITEEFELVPVLDMKKREKLPVIGYYAMFELMNGYKKELFWTKEEMESHAKKYSQSYRNGRSSFWKDGFDQMACKTMLRQLISKWGIMSPEMQTAYDADMSVIREDGTYDYVDNKVDAKADAKAEIEESANTEEFVESEVVG